MDAVESRTDETRADSSSSSGAGDYNSQRGAPGAIGGLKTHLCRPVFGGENAATGRARTPRGR